MGTFTPQDPQPCRLLPQREQAAAPWRTLAQRFRSRIVEPPKNFIQRLLNAFYRTVADRAEARADAISAEAGRIRMQADSLRGLAQAKEQQAEGLEAEATRLLAEATEAREEAASLRTEADTFTAQARAAETLAAEHRALAENPPLAQIATHYLYDPEGRLLGEYDEAGQVEREYVYLDHLPLAQITGTAIAYIHTDHLGTPESLTDQDQALVWQAHHDPFGRATVATQAVEHHLRFPGQYFDAETGLHYNYFRDYDPSIGRYIQSDPIGLAGGINPYLYANANPLRYTDPTGEIVLVLPAIAPALTALGEAV
ncbi:MAG: RHS repeat domain-containing protein, partial [Gammaproteobacteria bacterium]